MTMPIGRVKWYDKSKGYGFIENPEGDVFFHFSDIQMEGFKALAEDQRVSYKLLRSPEGLKAKQIKPLDNRASVKSAARYRAMVLMTVKPDCVEKFDRFMSDFPAWFDALQQDLGLRRIGTWRNGVHAVYLVESEKPYEQTLLAAENHPQAGSYRQWKTQLTELLENEPEIMQPVLREDEEI
jgi:CspA family cold shock protein